MRWCPAGQDRSIPPPPPPLPPHHLCHSGEDLLETLLRTPPPEPSRASMDDLGQQLQRGTSSSSDGALGARAGRRWGVRLGGCM